MSIEIKHTDDQFYVNKKKRNEEKNKTQNTEKPFNLIEKNENDRI